MCGHPRFKPKAGDTVNSSRDVPYSILRYFPITPRLQRLFMSKTTAQYMKWHVDGVRHDESVITHPADADAWKQFDATHELFAQEPRNVRLGLCTDGFNPFSGSKTPYSCWPVFVTPYNLPPSMCMRREYIFLSLLIPGPKSPGKRLDVYLRPLIDELKVLWDNGVTTYDAWQKKNFNMKAALLWTISDFPAYGMLSGWSTHGRLSCPICMKNTKSFRLQHGAKPCWFDCHRQYLPAGHAFRRDRYSFKKSTVENSFPPKRMSGVDILNELDKLEEANFGANSRGKKGDFGTIHNWGKTKDNANAREDLKLICKRPNLELVFENGKQFEDSLKELDPNISEDEILIVRDKDFSRWIKNQVDTGHIRSRIIQQIAYGPSKSVTSYNGLKVNGYIFHTKDHDKNRATMNSGVCVKGNIYGENDLDYYGILEEILELSYLGDGNSVFIFGCCWFDPINGVKVDERYGLVDIKYKSRLQSNEPFVLAEQAQQVYYTKYPHSGNKSNGEWWAACKVRAKLYMNETLHDPDEEPNGQDDSNDFYQDSVSELRAQNVILEDEVISLFDANAPMEEVNVEDINCPLDTLLNDEFINDNEDFDGENSESACSEDENEDYVM
ncbi:uncharacterized protein [Arachis hypogaea]|uniref:uncharacterized protein n=1 Tax=Arachis hypogaea TaxID=3818 RepID=UPI003B219042